MAKGDEFAGFFRRKNSGKTRGGQNVAFSDRFGLDQLECILFQTNLARGNRLPEQDWLGGDINHPGLATIIDVGEFFQLQRVDPFLQGPNSGPKEQLN